MGVVFDLNRQGSDTLRVQDGSHECGYDDVNGPLVRGADNGSAAANEGTKIFAINNFEVVHLDEMVEIDK